VTEQTIQRINLASFFTSLTTITLGVVIGLFGVWGVITSENGLLWKLLISDVILFLGGVLTNLAIACYKTPGAHAL